MEIELLRINPWVVFAKITVSVNEVYATVYSNFDGSLGEDADPPLTKEQVQKDYLSDRRSRFLPYDGEAIGSLLGVTATGEVADQVESGNYEYLLLADTDAINPLQIFSRDPMRYLGFTPREALDLLELLQNHQTELEELAEDQEDELNEEEEQEDED